MLKRLLLGLLIMMMVSAPVAIYAQDDDEAEPAPTEEATDETDQEATEEVTEDVTDDDMTEEAPEDDAEAEPTESLLPTDESAEPTDDMTDEAIETVPSDGVITIADYVANRAADPLEPEFTLLLAAIEAADESVLEVLSDPDADLTVFAPTDEAFEAVEGLDEILNDQELLTNILLYHVAPESATSDVIVNAFSALSTDVLLGAMLLPDDPLLITLNEQRTLVLDGVALVIAADFSTANGIIHVIDAVLVPDGE